MIDVLLRIGFWALLGLILLGAIAAGLRARRAALVAVGCDPQWLSRSWAHRRHVENKVIAIRTNHRRLS